MKRVLLPIAVFFLFVLPCQAQPRPGLGNTELILSHLRVGQVGTMPATGPRFVYEVYEILGPTEMIVFPATYRTAVTGRQQGSGQNQNPQATDRPLYGKPIYVRTLLPITLLPGDLAQFTGRWRVVQTTRYPLPNRPGRSTIVFVIEPAL
jgi:hypothetical protein